MPKISFQIPIEVSKVISKHPEINWNKVISNTLGNYTKKIRLLDSITSKSKLAEQDIEEIDHVIKSGLLKRYKKA
ncbi:MAG: hypothetical protein HYR79_02510 [Nitrospirae bacterium]|nr:hypothetical protein [Nitrospirota bacterium]